MKSQHQSFFSMYLIVPNFRPSPFVLTICQNSGNGYMEIDVSIHTIPDPETSRRPWIEVNPAETIF
jgi:hypothetical protein